MGDCGDDVGFAEESDLIAVFCDAAFVDGGVKEFGVCGDGRLGKGKKGISWYVFDVETYVGVFLGQRGQAGRELRIRKTGVDVVSFEGFRGHQR